MFAALGTNLPLLILSFDSRGSVSSSNSFVICPHEDTGSNW